MSNLSSLRGIHPPILALPDGLVTTTTTAAAAKHLLLPRPSCKAERQANFVIQVQNNVQ